MSRPSSGQGERWNAIRARRAEELRDAQAQALVDAFKAELAARDPLEQFASAVSAAVRQNASRRIGPGGRLGGPRSAAQKASIMAEWAAARDEHRARHGKGYSISGPSVPAMLASAFPAGYGDVSPLLRRIYDQG
jgi:hypothetical protein